MANQKSSKRAVTIETSAAKYLADGLLAAASKDNLTPILCAGFLRVEGARVRGYSTDRYRVHAPVVDAVTATGDHEFLIHRDLIEWLSKNARAFYSRGATPYKSVVVIETTDTDVSVTVKQDESGGETLTRTGKTVAGNFPPVWTLIETARDAELAEPGDVSLNLAYLSSIRALGDSRVPTQIRFTKSTRRDLPGAAYFVFKTGEKVHAEALLQPHRIE